MEGPKSARLLILGIKRKFRTRKYAALYSRIPRAIGAGLIPAIVRRLPVSHDRVSFDYKAKRFVTGAYLSPAAGHCFADWIGC